MNMSQKLVVVLGATGLQGSSVVKALLKTGGYAIRGVTRNIDGPAVQALRAQGIEVVHGDSTDKASLVAAFAGAYAVFGVTIGPKELLQGTNIVDACKETHVPLLVWSSLPSVTELSQGKFTEVRYFDDKHEVDRYMQVTGQPGVILHTGHFCENLLNAGYLRPDPSRPGEWMLGYPVIRPTTVMSGIWIEGDLGNIVVAIIENWEDASWRAILSKETIPAASFLLSTEMMMESVRRVTGRDVAWDYNVELPDYLKINPQGLQFVDSGLYRYPGPNPPQILLKLGVKFHTLDDFVREKVVPFMQQKQK